MSSLSSSKKMTDEERLHLAAKLDRELDEFIDGLEKKRYTEGWPEDRWQEEMEKHPFFMKKAPEPGDELHPLLEGIQQLKYDPNENTAEDLAQNYKEDGNFYVKHKKYRTALISFTEGLKVNCNNSEINSVLYNNRSAAHFFLKNYRSSLLDAQKALELNSNYYKAKWRAAQCAFHLQKYDLAIKYCEQILQNDTKNESARDLLRKSKTKKQEVERDERRRQAYEKRRLTQLNRTIDELKKRNNIKFDEIKTSSEITEDILKPKLLPLEDYPVKFDENEELIWPSAFSYPEFLFTDFKQQLSENTLMIDCIYEILSEKLECDKENKYSPNSVEVYYENRKAGSVHKVDLKKTIREIIEEKNFYVNGGALLFYIVPKNSHIEKEFIEQVRRPLQN